MKCNGTSKSTHLARPEISVGVPRARRRRGALPLRAQRACVAMRRVLLVRVERACDARPCVRAAAAGADRPVRAGVVRAELAHCILSFRTNDLRVVRLRAVRARRACRVPHAHNVLEHVRLAGSARSSARLALLAGGARETRFADKAAVARHNARAARAPRLALLRRRRGGRPNRYADCAALARRWVECVGRVAGHLALRARLSFCDRVKAARVAARVARRAHRVARQCFNLGAVPREAIARRAELVHHRVGPACAADAVGRDLACCVPGS